MKKIILLCLRTFTGGFIRGAEARRALRILRANRACRLRMAETETAIDARSAELRGLLVKDGQS